MTKIAITIPSFNSEDTISNTLESIQSQSGWLTKISTVFLADDCSSDRTVELAEQIWKEPIPLQVLKAEKNLGERGNVNRTIALLKDSIDWILLLHSDDIAKPNWLEMMVSRIQVCSEHVGSICSSWDNLMLDGSVLPGENKLNEEIRLIEGNDDSVKETLLAGCWWHISGCAIRLKTFEDCGGFKAELPQLGDWEWLLRCLHNGWSVEYIPKTLILYRQHANSVSSKSFQTHRDVREFLQIIPQYIHLLKSTDCFHLYLARLNWLVRRMIRASFTLNHQRFLQSCQVLFMLLVSWRECQKQLKLYQQQSLSVQ